MRAEQPADLFSGPGELVLAEAALFQSTGGVTVLSRIVGIDG